MVKLAAALVLLGAASAQPAASWRLLPAPVAEDGGVVFDFVNPQTPSMDAQMVYKIHGQAYTVRASVDTDPINGDTMVHLNNIDDSFELVSVILSAVLADGKTYEWAWIPASSGVRYAFEYPKIRRAK